MSPIRSRRTNRFFLAPLLLGIICGMPFAANAFDQPADGLGLFPAITATTPATLRTTTAAPGVVPFGFDTVIFDALKTTGPLHESISKDPDYRSILVKMHGVFVDLNVTAIGFTKTPPQPTDKINLLNEMTKRWEDNFRTVMNNDKRAQLWTPLVKLIKQHRKTKESDASKFDHNEFSHRAEVYHELAVGIARVVQEYDAKEEATKKLIDDGVIPDSNSSFDSGSFSDPDTSRCKKKKKRCALELLF